LPKVFLKLLQGGQILGNIVLLQHGVGLKPADAKSERKLVTA
jgi:hypothetical protein